MVTRKGETQIQKLRYQTQIKRLTHHFHWEEPKQKTRRALKRRQLKASLQTEIGQGKVYLNQGGYQSTKS